MEHKIATSILMSLVFIYILFGWLIHFYYDRDDSPEFRALIHSVRIVYPCFFLMLVFSRGVMNIGYFEGLTTTYANMWFLTLTCMLIYHYHDYFPSRIPPDKAIKIAYVLITGLALNICLMFPGHGMGLTIIALTAILTLPIKKIHNND